MSKIWGKIEAFLKSMFSNRTDTEPKFVVGAFCTLLWGVMIIFHLITHTNIQSELIWANVGLIASCFGIDAWMASKAMSVKSSVASDTVKSDSSKQSNDTAKEVIQGEEPK